MHIISLWQLATAKCIQQQRLKEKRYACAFQFTVWWRERKKLYAQINIFSFRQGKNGEKAQARRMQNVRVAFYHFSAVNHLESERGRKSAALLLKCAV
jgi:hypothetical protein